MNLVSSPAWQPPSLEQMQTALPEFRFEELLGRGGMGAVYRAVQVSLGRTVAVKVLPAALMQRGEADYAVRFAREARVMGELNHPGIVSVFGFGCAAGGLLYMVMEHVDGTDLSRHLRDCGRLPPDKAADFITQVCAALDCAHRAGIIHRDIKPANILIAHDGTVKVADFGLARLEDPAARGLTKTNVAAGTPEFLAPEALLSGAAVDARADIYALGVVLYQMLTGELPHGRWKLPGERCADARFDAVIRKAMQTDPGARYQSTVALQRDLHAALTAAPRRRIPLRFAIAAAAAMILLAAAAWHWRPHREASALDSGAEPSSRVTNNNGSGPGSLQQALLHAEQTPGPDTITFDPSLSGQTIVLETRFVPFDIAPPPPDISAAFTVDASSLPGGLTIKPPAGFNAFIFKHAECDVTLRGLTLSGGGGAYGSFLINDGTITLLDCRITGNQASANGGALGNNGTMRLVRCLVSSNTAGGKGGAINTLGTFIAEDCTFSGNTAALGGAVSVGGGTAEFTRCTFYGNEASRTGGAITIFRTVKATHCTFAGNKATGTATGIHGGGAFAFMDSGGALELDACIVAGNTAVTGHGPDIWRQAGKVSAARSLIGIADDTGITTADGNLTGSLAQPLDAKLSPPGDYGGRTQTMPPLPDSPAKAAAKGSTATVDQRGLRIEGVPSIGAAQ